MEGVSPGFLDEDLPMRIGAPEKEEKGREGERRRKEEEKKRGKGEGF